MKYLRGANMDIDLVTPASSIAWVQDTCPWNAVDGTNAHRCAVKNISICDYFRGVKALDTVLCAYPEVSEAGG
jgi:hypothetical protein